MIASTAFKLYPKRAVLGLALFIGRAFIYNGITFNLGTLLSTFYGVSSGIVPVFIAVYAFGNFLGPVLLGRLFDTVGRIPMISISYLGSAVLTVPLAWLFATGSLSAWGFLALIVGVFFLASAGASAAYLTVSEIFPMETRALAIAFLIAAGVMAIGGIAEIFLGVRAEGANLEDIAKPLTAELRCLFAERLNYVARCRLCAWVTVRSGSDVVAGW